MIKAPCSICRICACKLHEGDDLLRVVRETEKEVHWYHTECFRDEAGDFYIPHPTTRHEKSKRMREYVDTMRREWNLPDGALFTQEDFGNYASHMVPEIFKYAAVDNRLDGISTQHVCDKLAYAIEADVQSRISIGLEASCRIVPSSEFSGYTTLITIKGTTVFQVVTKIPAQELAQFKVIYETRKNARDM